MWLPTLSTIVSSLFLSVLYKISLGFLLPSLVKSRWRADMCKIGTCPEQPPTNFQSAPMKSLKPTGIALPSLGQHRALTPQVTFGPSKKHFTAVSRRPRPLLVPEWSSLPGRTTQCLQARMNHHTRQSIVSHSCLNPRFCPTVHRMIRHIYIRFAWPTRAISPTCAFLRPRMAPTPEDG